MALHQRVIEKLKATFAKDGRKVVSTQYYEDDLPLLIWAYEQGLNLSDLHKLALRAYKDQMEAPPQTPTPAPVEVDYNQFRAIIRQELAGLTIAPLTQVDEPPPAEVDEELLGNLMNLF